MLPFGKVIAIFGQLLLGFGQLLLGFGQLLLEFGQLLLALALRITTIYEGLVFSQTRLTRCKLKPFSCPERAASARVTCQYQFDAVESLMKH